MNASAKLFKKFSIVGPPCIARDALNHGQHILGAVIDLLHEEFDLLFPVALLCDICICAEPEINLSIFILDGPGAR